jgi:hypothetical protein
LPWPAAAICHNKCLHDGKKIADTVWFKHKGIGAGLDRPRFIRGISRCQDTDDFRLGRLNAVGQFKAVDFGDMDIRKKNMNGLGCLDVLPG